MPGAARNAVVYSSGKVYVADSAGYLSRFDAASGSLDWQSRPSGAGTVNSGYWASPALSGSGVLYAVDNSATVYAVNAADGTAVAGFGTNGAVPIQSGSESSPLVDAAGNLLLEGGDATLRLLTPGGTTLWTIPGWQQNGAPPPTGTTGARSPAWMSPALSADGTIYVGGNHPRWSDSRRCRPAPRRAIRPPAPHPWPWQQGARMRVRVTRRPRPGRRIPTRRRPRAPRTPTAGPSDTPLVAFSPTPAGSPTAGDMVQLDEANAQYTRNTDGGIEVKYYVAPVGMAERSGWVLRDPTLHPAPTSLLTGTGALSPAGLPFPCSWPRVAAQRKTPRSRARTGRRWPSSWRR